MSRPMQVDRSGVAARYQKLLEPQALEALRRGFNQMNKGMVPLWRLGLGRVMNVWPEGTGRILVLEHIGRRSGALYRTPLNYAALGDDLYCVAAFGERTHWYRNILAAPDIAVWLPDGRWLATVEDASEDPGRLAAIREVLVSSGFVAPMIGLRPRQMSDDDLAEATSMYRLLRIRPSQKRWAATGPGDLTWMWMIVLGALLAVIAGSSVRRR